MFDHVTLRTADVARTARLLTAPLAALGIDPDGAVEFEDLGYLEDEPLTRHVHVGLVAATPEDVDAFWRAGVAAGLESDGAPGPRPQYGDDYYGGFLLDPEGNSIEACLHENSRQPSIVDHVWLRVRDLAASREFYVAIAAQSGFALVVDEPELARFRGPSASLTVIEGAPVSAHLHLAFPATDDSTVDAFHAAALSAGAPDNGAPGERRRYHPGYYGAFVLDPDGHNVEVVNHNR